MKKRITRPIASSDASLALTREEIQSNISALNRRSFLKSGMFAGAAATVGAGILTESAFGTGDQDGSGTLNRGDAAILQFLAAAEIIETDLWLQSWELGGTQDN